MWQRFEKWTSLALLVSLSGAIVPMVVSQEYPADVNTLSDYRLLFLELILYSSFLAILALDLLGNKPLVIPPFWISILVLWATLSVSWANDPGWSSRRFVWDLLAMQFGLYLGHRFTNEEEVDLLVKALTFCAVLSVGVAVLDPSWAFMRGGALAGDLRGVFSQKNELGRNMVLLCSGCIYQLKVKQLSGKGRTLMLLALAVGLLIASKSATSLVLFASLFILLALFRVLRLPGFQLIVGGFFTGLVLLGLAAVLVANVPALLALLGKRPDLTGRTELWAQVITAIESHPWCGYGVHSFWKGMYGPSASVIEAVGWDVPHAHNGFLDLLLDVGAIGLVFFALAFITATWGAIRNYRETRSEKNLWPLMLLALFAAGNLTESSILGQSLLWTLFMSSTYRISRRGAFQHDSARENTAAMIPVPAIVQLRGANR